MSDDKPIPFPVPTPPEPKSPAEMHAIKLNVAVRHLYGTALTMCRLTDGGLSDAPRILIAAAAHSVSTLLERMVNLEKTIETIDQGDRFLAMATLDKLAIDLNETVRDLEMALRETLDNLHTVVAAEDEPAPPAPKTH
jgi:hypothetical protein